MATQLGVDVTGVLGRLDAVRAAVLGRTLRVPALRQLFHSRPERLGVAFAANTLIVFPLAVWQPLLLLAVGPLLFGLAHLGATVRYVGKTPALLTALLAVVAMVRLVFPTEDNRFELLALGVFLLGLGALGLAGTRQLVAAVALLSPLLVASFEDPLVTIQVLILTHNFVAFFFWIRAALPKGEAALPVACFAVFSVLNLLILTLPVARFETAYAFGQATHYFVWLRAIPEQTLTPTAPVSFRRSWKLLERDFGGLGALLAVFVVAALSLTWLLVTWEDARRIYFAIAAFHGYAEIAIMAVLLGGRLTRA